MGYQGPQIDPLFPDRPKHPDFWALAEAIADAEDRLEAGEDWEKILTPIVDPECLAYMSQQRAARARQTMRDHGLPFTPAAVFFDAFLVGAQYGMTKVRLELGAPEPGQVIDVEPSAVSDELIEDEPECASAC
jgi:hypothetical protein